MLGRVFKELLITSENPRVVATLRILLNYHENTRFASRKRPDNLYTNYGFYKFMKINTCSDTELSSSNWLARKFFPPRIYAVDLPRLGFTLPVEICHGTPR